VHTFPHDRRLSLGNQCAVSGLCERVKSIVQRRSGAVELLLRDVVFGVTVRVKFIAAGAEIVRRESLCDVGEQGSSEVHNLWEGKTKLASRRLIGKVGPRSSVEARNIFGVSGPNDSGVAGCIDFLVEY